jgi:hypothetical protein
MWLSDMSLLPLLPLWLLPQSQELRSSLEVAASYGRRLFPTSKVLVVAVASDGSARQDWEPRSIGLSSSSLSSSPSVLSPSQQQQHLAFLGEPLDASGVWREYFDDLLANASPRDEANKADSGGGASTSASISSSTTSGGGGAYVALNFRGRSVASGRFGSAAGADASGGSSSSLVNWDELLGRRFVPTEMLIPDDGGAASAAAAAESDDEEGVVKDDPSSQLSEVLSLQRDFYSALISGDGAAMEELFRGGRGGGSSSSSSSSSSSNGVLRPEVSEVLAEGGRLDNWTFCLLDGNRPPSGMKVSNADATLFFSSSSSTDVSHATTTLLEFPTGPGGASQLSMQRWEPLTDADAAAEAEARWRLVAHRTIPYSAGSGAGALLRCDCRGCVALLATQDTGTSGGLKGLVDSWI